MRCCDPHSAPGRGFGRLLVLLLVAGLCSLAAAGGALSAPRAEAGSCKVTQPKSIAGSVATTIEFVNSTSGTVKVYWLSYSGQRVYYATLPPGKSYTQRTFDTNPWVILNSAGGCIGYVIAPQSRYVISGSASSAAPPPTTTAPAPKLTMPHWVYQMINDFNLGISQPSGALSSSLTIYKECSASPPDWAFVDGNSLFFNKVIETSYVPYEKLLSSWIGLIGTLKASPVTAQARAKLKVAQPLHTDEVNAWEAASGAIKEHDCARFLSDLREAAQAGAPEWADQYAAVKAIAGIYGQAGSASDQSPYAQKIG